MCPLSTSLDKDFVRYLVEGARLAVRMATLCLEQGPDNKVNKKTLNLTTLFSPQGCRVRENNARRLQWLELVVKLERWTKDRMFHMRQPIYPHIRCAMSYLCRN